MKPEMLQVQQYLNIHPIVDKDKGIRKKYFVLLNYFVEKQGKGDLWTKQELDLYKKAIVGNDVELANSKTVDFSIFEKFKFFKYRYYLLTDSLFIRAFNDNKCGRRIVEDIIQFYGEKYRKKLERIYAAFYSFDDESLLKSFPDLKSTYVIIWNNRRFQRDPIKKVIITANMSAGKSTLLNALAGKNVTKMQNDTCTAKLHYLYNKAGEDGFNYELDHDLELDASLDVLMTDNNENEDTDIIVGTRFRSLCDINQNLVLIDTPGVNSSMDKEHRRMANEAIKSIKCDLLIYLFNGENIGSDDDKNHLEYVRNNYTGRILFLVNRIDHKKKEDDSVSNTIEKTRQELLQIGFEKPEIYPISAYAAFLAKMKMFGEDISDEEIEELDGLKRILKKDSFSYEKYYPVELKNINLNNSLNQLLLNSGILSLEDILKSL